MKASGSYPKGFCNAVRDLFTAEQAASKALGQPIGFSLDALSHVAASRGSGLLEGLGSAV